LQAVGVLPAWVAVWEVDADVALAHRAEHRVGQRVRQSVGVRVPLGPALRLDHDAPQHERTPLRQTVRVVPDADAKHEINRQ
jgi:hypothetical protein